MNKIALFLSISMILFSCGEDGTQYDVPKAPNIADRERTATPAMDSSRKALQALKEAIKGDDNPVKKKERPRQSEERWAGSVSKDSVKAQNERDERVASN